MTVSGGFLIKDTAVLLSSFRWFDLRTLLTADKTPGTESVPLGGSDPTNLLGGSTSQKVGSLPPKLRVLSAVFFHGLKVVSPSFFGAYASGRQNASGTNRPEHCVCFSVLFKLQLQGEETAAA